MGLWIFFLTIHQWLSIALRTNIKVLITVLAHSRSRFHLLLMPLLSQFLVGLLECCLYVVVCVCVHMWICVCIIYKIVIVNIENCHLFLLPCIRAVDPLVWVLIAEKPKCHWKLTIVPWCPARILQVGNPAALSSSPAAHKLLQLPLSMLTLLWRNLLAWRVCFRKVLINHRSSSSWAGACCWVLRAASQG